ncbi:hypothetical protein MHU86_25358 [Fragilaria crotonensis]|nr:hypothetical protein MHU86_25358 [Fragilaria crotonensis]
MSTRLSRAFPNLDSPMLWPASSTPPADDAPDRIPLRMDSRGGRSQPGSPPALRAGPRGSRGRPTVQRGDTRIRISIRRAPGAAPPHALVALPRAHFRRRGFSLREISDADRLADVRDNLARGNHKSARGHEAKLISMLKEEVERGWQLPLPRAALELEGCEVAPLGMVAQTSIDEKGQTIEKLRLTHDQSFNPSGIPGRSVNDRVDTSQLTTARFGRAFSRLMYHISYLRQLWPKEPILLTKVDCKSAYRRIHLKARTALKSCTSIDDLLLVALRMTFGGAPNPSQWSDVSEVITDLANDLVRRSDWDPKVFHSPHQHLLDSDEAVDNDDGMIDGRANSEKPISSL